MSMEYEIKKATKHEILFFTCFPYTSHALDPQLYRLLALLDLLQLIVKVAGIDYVKNFARR